MQKATREIERETDALVFDQGKNRPVVLTIKPGRLLGVRLKGTRRNYDLPADSIYSMAVKAEIEAKKAEKRKRKLK